MCVYINIHIYTYTQVYFFFCFLGPHLRHMEVPRLGVELERQLLAYAMHSKVGSEPHLQPTPQLMATPDPSPTEQGHGY